MTKTYGNFTDFIDFSRASSGTYLGSDGLLKTAADNVPRVEYDSSGVLKGLLIEEQRTNLVTTSEALSGGNWFNNGGTISENTVVAPDGTMTGNTYSTDGAYRILRNVATVSSSTAYTWSFYVKNVDATSLNYRVYDNTNTVDVVAATSYFSSASTTEWTRIEVTFTTPATCTSIGVYVCSGDQGGTAAFWGAQLEQGSFATSLIPTSGAIATRSADIADIATANFGYNPKAGTVVVDFDNLKFEAGGSRYPRPFELGSASHAGERINVYVGESTQNLAFGINTANAAQAGATLLAGVSSPVGPYKISVAFKKNDVAAVETGGGVLTDTSADISGVVYPRNTLQIGGSAIGTTNQVNGHIKSIKYIPRRNSNTQLQEFTS